MPGPGCGSRIARRPPPDSAAAASRCCRQLPPSARNKAPMTLATELNRHET